MKALQVRETRKKSRVEREGGGGVVEVDQFSAQHVLCVRLTSSLLMEQTKNQDQATT